MKKLDREILDFLTGGPIAGSTDQDAVGELIDLCDKFETAQAGEIRDRLEVLLDNGFVTKKNAGRRPWGTVSITDEGREALEEDDGAENSAGAAAATTEDSVGAKFEAMVSRLRQLASDANVVADDLEELGSATAAELESTTTALDKAEGRAEAAEARYHQLKERVATLLEEDSDES